MVGFHPGLGNGVACLRAFTWAEVKQGCWLWFHVGGDESGRVWLVFTQFRAVTWHGDEPGWVWLGFTPVWAQWMVFVWAGLGGIHTDLGGDMAQRLRIWVMTCSGGGMQAKAVAFAWIRAMTWHQGWFAGEGRGIHADLRGDVAPEMGCNRRLDHQRGGACSEGV